MKPDRSSAAALTVGAVAARSGVAVSTLHFYESKGLIRSARTSGNQRRYSRDVLRRVSFVRVAQRLGIPLAEVAAALDALPDRRTPTRADWARVSLRWRDALDRRIEQLLRLRNSLDDCIGCGCLSIDSCQLRNPGDALGARGPGAHRLTGGRLKDEGRRLKAASGEPGDREHRIVTATSPGRADQTVPCRPGDCTAGI